MNKTEKIEVAKVQPDNRVHYKPLRAQIINMKTRRQGLMGSLTKCVGSNTLMT